jgi:hypothetical protein
VSNLRFGILVYLALLVACAIVGVVETVGGEPLDYFQISESLAVTLVCGGGLYAGVALLQRRQLVAFAGLVVALEAIAFVVAMHAIWTANLGEIAGRWSSTFVALAIGALVVAAVRTTMRGGDPVTSAAFLGTALCWTIATGFVLKLIWTDPIDFDTGTVKTATSFYVLGAFGFLATPALERFRRSADDPAGAGPSTTI